MEDGDKNEEIIYDYDNNTMEEIKKNTKKNLIVLGSLKTGKKLWLQDNLLSHDICYIPSLTRKIYGQNHHSIIKFIDNMFRYICSSDDIINEHVDLLILLEKAIIGVDNMRKTYLTYFDKLTLIIARIDVYIFNNKIELP